MLKLRRLKIEKFRSVVPGTEIRFSDGFNVLLGQNGTGKTTLLELISSVVRSDFWGLREEAFSIEYDIVLGDIAITVALHNEPQEQPPPLPTTWRATMDARVVARGEATSIRRENGHLRVNGELAEGGEHSPLLGSGAVYFTIVFRALHRTIDQANQFFRAGRAVRFDESLEVFRTLTTHGHPTVKGIVTTSPRDSKPYLVPESTSIPTSMFDKLESLYQADPSTSRFVFSDRDLAFLRSASETMGFDSAQAELDVLSRRSMSEHLSRIELGNLAFRFQFKDGGDMVSHERLSYGQKRLLTFFCYLDMCPDVIIADELVNGLHHAWISAAVEAIGERQSFLTSQNPLLLDYLPIVSPEQVRDSFIFCRSERPDRRPRWIWENMSAEDAAELFSAYGVGIEHVSEILQSRGLW